jgi:two-component system sensor histidine kinase PhoQ
MRSLNTRVLVAAGIVLAAFLSAAGLALDQAFKDSALTSVRERLASRIYLVLGTIDLNEPARGMPEAALSGAALATPESGHYAQLLDGAGTRVWNSRSMLGITFPGPPTPPVGEFSFKRTSSSTGESLLVLSYTVLWEGEGSQSSPYTVQVAENEQAFMAQVNRFRRSLLLGFSAIGVVLLLLQTGIFRWGLKPLRDVAHEVNLIERGERSAISGEYPQELRPLAENLNALIRTNESSVKRYRNALGDLAHSLKTPLAVVRTTLADRIAEPGPNAVRESLDQLDATIAYQLQRAAAAGRSAIGGVFEIAPVATQIENSLKKVHADRHLEFSSTFPADAKFQGDRGDFMEMLGNIADNACKWARSKVSVQVSFSPKDAQPRLLLIEVRDDGTGMPEADIAKALLRGSRLDQSTAGHGIGLAVVKELVEDVYGGALEIHSSPAGTRVVMKFPGY